MFVPNEVTGVCALSKNVKLTSKVHPNLNIINAWNTKPFYMAFYMAENMAISSFIIGNLNNFCK